MNVSSPLALILLASFGCGSDDDPSLGATDAGTNATDASAATDVATTDATTTDATTATTAPTDATTTPTDATTATTTPTDATTTPTDATTTPTDATTDTDSSAPSRCTFDDECEGGRVCSPNNECVWCTEAGNDPCFAGICDPNTKQCRRCTSNADCTGIYLGKICDPGGTGGCIDCHVIDWPCKDAPGGPHCNYQNHRCEPCRDSFDCSSAGLAGSCQDGECVGCTDDAQCEIGICHLPAGTCGHCTSDAECVGNPNGPTCKTSGGAGHGKCYGCKTNDDCGFTNKCDVATGLCGSGCTTDADCANGSFPTCITDAGGLPPFCGCKLTSVCPNPALPSCDSYHYQCEASCSDDSECTYPEVCWSGMNVCMIGFPDE